MEIAQLRQWAEELGFSKMGICSPDAFAQEKKTVDVQAQIKERKQLRFYPADDYPEAKALLVLLYPYHPARLPQDGEQLFIDQYYNASNRAYHAASLLEKRIQSAGFMAQANVPYPAKAAALRAGLGLIGDHGLLITPDYGTRVVIILLATNAVEPEEKEPRHSERSQCLHCGKCENACPVKAIDAAGGFHPERCLRNYMMEGVVVPEDVRRLMGQSLIGCDRCQRVCPLQPDCTEHEEEAFTLRDFLTEDEQRFKHAVNRLAGQIGRNAARPQRVRAQAALLAGNMKTKEYANALCALSKSPFDAVRVHAQWALEQIDIHDSGLDQFCEKR